LPTNSHNEENSQKDEHKQSHVNKPPAHARINYHKNRNL